MQILIHLYLSHFEKPGVSEVSVYSIGTFLYHLSIFNPFRFLWISIFDQGLLGALSRAFTFSKQTTATGFEYKKTGER